MAKLYIITGPAGVGKSTVSEKIVKQSEKSALIEGDDIYHYVKGGYVSPWLEGNHLEVFWENSLDVISNFLTREYDVVFNYIVSKEDIVNIKSKLKGIEDVEIKFVVLMVDENTIVARDKQRASDCQMGERSLILLEEFKSMGFSEKNILDTTNLTVEETVEAVINENRFLI